MDHVVDISQDDPDDDPTAVRQAIRTRAERIEQQELQQAFHRLEAYGTLDDDQRRIIEELASAIVDEIISPPESALTDPSYDDETVRTAIELFDPSEESAYSETGVDG